MLEENTWLLRMGRLLVPLCSLVRLGGTEGILGNARPETFSLREEVLREETVGLLNTLNGVLERDRVGESSKKS